MTTTPEPMFGGDDCTCRPFTRQTDPPRFLDQPGDTVNMISGWERGTDCLNHAPRPLADTPDTDRQARRDAIQDLLVRIGRGRAGPDIATPLANYVTAEQADGDQAREQLAEAERGHNTRRVDLTQALGQRMDLGWPALLGSVRSVQQANTDLRGNADRYHTDRDRWKADAEQARRGEAEAVRAREAAEQMLGREQRIRRETEDQLAASRRATGQARIRSGRNFADARRNRDAWRNARKRARHLNILVDTLALDPRAERAEATLTAVRAIHVRTDARRALDLSLRPIPTCAGCGETWPCPTAVALGDPQPATEPEQRLPWMDLLGVLEEPADRTVAHRSQLSGGLFCPRCAPVDRTTPLTSSDLNGGPGICCACGADVLIDPDVREQPATTGTIFALPGGIRPARPSPEITLIGANTPVHVTPQQVADAVRRILREDRATVRDLLQ